MLRNAFFRNHKYRLAQTGLLLAASIALMQPALAADNLSRLEEGLFSTSYTGEAAAQRLNRLESSVFGEAQTGTDSSRITRLENALGHLLQSKSTSPSAEQPAATAQEAPSFAPAQNVQPQRPPDATDYPTVTALERQVFGRDFIRDDVGQRLDRLEKKVYGQAYPQTALADRVDKLLSRYPNLNQQANGGTPQPVEVSPALSNLPNDARQFSGSDRDVYTKLDALERHLFNGKSHPNALLTERLDRLEKSRFNRTFGGESVDTRLNRLMAQYQSSNGSQVANRPGFQERQPYQPSASQPYGTTGGNPPPRQNIQIGSGFSSNSSYSFSPEMRSMLPPSVQGQMNNMSPSTVVVERQQFGTPGFQNYNPGAPIQHYNYYGAPGTQTQSQSSTTIIQPNGSQVVYGYPGAQAAPGMQMGIQNGLPNPAYAGDPAVFQSIGRLETQVFGQVNTVEPMPVRLGKLESKVMGQMFPGLPDTQRLENLEKAHQQQAINKLLKNNQGIGRGSGGFSIGVPIGPNPLNPFGMQNAMPMGPGRFGW